MALREAILDVCDEMEKFGEGSNYFLVDFAKQIRRIVKASECNPYTSPGLISSESGVHGYVDHLGRFHSAKKVPLPSDERIASELISESPDRMCNCVGGSLDGCLVPIPSNLKPGHSSSINGQVYSYREDGNLHFNETKTKEVIQSK